MDLHTKVLQSTFESPLMLGSGTLVETPNSVIPFLDAGAGAVVPRTTRLHMTRKTHPVPHLYQGGQKKTPFMLNAEWTGADIAYWLDSLQGLADLEKVVMSVSGRDITGCVDVCRVLDKYKWPYLEINVSCAHSNSVHGWITRNSDYIRQLVQSIKDAGVKTPIGIKLGHSDFIVELAQVAKDAGAEMIVAINTVGPVFDFDISSGMPKSVVGIEGAKGGLSGSPIFHTALTDVATISSQVQIPVIGCGGVSSVEHVVKMLMAGAQAVQLYTSAHVLGVNAPQIFTKLNQQLIGWLTSNGYRGVEEIKGFALPLLSQPTTLKVVVPQVLDTQCVGCDLCVPVCLPGSISILEQGDNKAGHVVLINESSCVGCGHCVSVCPTTPSALVQQRR